MNTKHTPLPWRASHLHVYAEGCGKRATDGYDDHNIIERTDGRTPEEAVANAAFIVQACNAYEHHIALLRAVADFMHNGNLVGCSRSVDWPAFEEEIKAAIAAAEKETT